MSGGITYGVAKSIFAKVVENGLCADDDRVRMRTNEAIASLLHEMIPVGGMITADVAADGTELLLPKEFENAIEVEVLDGDKVRGQTDVTQGWYDIVNPFTYVDPETAHDNPLVDLGQEPDESDPTILRRRYDYPGLRPQATVRVTGAKRYLPIASDADYLIIQNGLAIKLEIMSIEMLERNSLQEGQALHEMAIAKLTAEVKKHQLDPRNVMKRKGNYEADLVNYPQGTFGYVRARLAFEVPGAMSHGKSEISRMLEQSEMRIMDKGHFVGTIEEFTAEVVNGYVLFPARVKAVLRASSDCGSIDIRSIFHAYLKNGPGMECSCSKVLRDEGEHRMEDGQIRRKYLLQGAYSDVAGTLSAVCKLRWVKKAPGEVMTIRNFEALRLMFSAIAQEKGDKLAEAQAFEGKAMNEVEKELRDYLSGVQHAISFESEMGFGELGATL